MTKTIIVPVEPTEEMMDAGLRIIEEGANYDPTKPTPTLRNAFKAMIAAAPKPIPADDRATLIGMLNNFPLMRFLARRELEQIADAAISTLISLGWSRHESFQSRVKPWMLECFGPVIPFDKTERNHRFLEEALELVQSLGCTQSEAHQLVDYVYNRPAGDPPQESGGVMVTHAALCIANNMDMMHNAETELARIWTKVEQIRAKQDAKPKHSPLPGPASIHPPEGER